MAASPLHGWACPICAAALADERRRRRVARCTAPARGRQGLRRPHSPPEVWLAGCVLVQAVLVLLLLWRL